jgi:hypothetical protein
VVVAVAGEKLVTDAASVVASAVALFAGSTATATATVKEEQE